MHTRISLRSKLAWLLIVSLLFTVFPIMIISYHYVSDTVLVLEKRSFHGMLRIVEEKLHSSFLDLVTSKVRHVLERKNALRSAALHYEAYLDFAEDFTGAPRGGRGEVGDMFANLFASEDIHVGLYSAGELLRRSSPLFGISPNGSDFKKRPLQEILRHLSGDGDFAVFPPEAGAGGAPVLLYVLPRGKGYMPLREKAGNPAKAPGADSPGQFIVCATRLEHLENEETKNITRIVEELHGRLAGIYSFPKGFIALFDSRGALLSGYGDQAAMRSEALRPLLELARAGHMVERVLRFSAGKDGEHLVLVNFVRPFQWSAVIAAPLAVFDQPARQLIGRLALLSCIAGALSLFTALAMLSRVVRPLRLLTEKAKGIAELHFSPGAAEELPAQLPAQLPVQLPLTRGDEVGDLARAFESMGEKLAENVSARIAATAAKERLQSEMRSAAEIQQGILPAPDTAPANALLDSYALLEPAREVGGDLYDFFPVPGGRLAFIIGDVSGKGVPAALFMSMTAILVRSALADGLDPAQAMAKVNRLLSRGNVNCMFVTLFIALYEPRTGALDYANGGHLPPLVFSPDSRRPLRSLAEESCPLLGVSEDAGYTTRHDVLERGELCLMMTDGATEAWDASGNFWAQDGLEDYIAAHRAASPRELVTGIARTLTELRGPAEPYDDVTLLAFARSAAKKENRGD